MGLLNMNYKTKRLRQIGVDSWSRPVFMDKDGKLWKDVNCGDGEPSLYSASDNDFDGEPEWPISESYENTMRSEANRFIGVIREYGMSLDTFLELYSDFGDMPGDARVLVYKASGDRYVNKEDNKNGE